MTSETPRSAFVWIWLPDAVEPIVAGRLDRTADRFAFAYGRSYLERPNAVSIYGPELPLDNFEHESLDGPMPLETSAHRLRRQGRRPNLPRQHD